MRKTRIDGSTAARAACVLVLLSSAPCTPRAPAPVVTPPAVTVPTDDPASMYGLAWTGRLPWTNVVGVTDVPGATAGERLAAAQARLGGRGGVVYFPAGTYTFTDHVLLEDGVILRGAPPIGETDARKDEYQPATRFVFPRYVPRFEGAGTPNETAWKGIRARSPATASRLGVVHVAIDFGHVELGEGPDHAAGSERLVLGCVLTNAAVASREIPGAGQHAWQRFTDRFHAAIGVWAGRDALVARNRLPASQGGSFTQPNYVLPRTGQAPLVPAGGVRFDMDNRPGITLNKYTLGGSGADGDDATPKTHPHGFRKGLVIRDNYVFATGRAAIAFSGDGTRCQGNVIRFQAEVTRPTTTGLNVTTPSSTNDNRAVEMRGWRWQVTHNDYEVHRNLCADGKNFINDGEGLMHEDHANSTVLDSLLAHNHGNAYLSIYKTGGVDGLVVQGNDIRTHGGIAAIFVVANRNASHHPLRNVSILDNITAGSGIRVAGAPAEGVVLRDNQHVGPGGSIKLEAAGAVVEDNAGFVMEK